MFLTETMALQFTQILQNTQLDTAHVIQKQPDFNKKEDVIGSILALYISEKEVP